MARSSADAYPIRGIDHATPETGMARPSISPQDPDETQAATAGTSDGRPPRARLLRWSRRWWLGGAVAALLLVVALARSARDTGPPPHTVPVRRGTIVKSVVATGKTEPKSKVEIKSKVNGIVKRLPVATGDVVSEGQVVAELDREVAEARVEEARAAVAAAHAIAEQARAAVTSAERTVAQQDLARLRALKEEQIISARELDRGWLDAEMAASRDARARAALDAAIARVARAEAVLEQAENELRYATIVSPLTGTVLALPIEVGSGVSGINSVSGFGSAIMTVGDVSQLHVVGQVDEVDIGSVTVGLPARVRVDAFPATMFQGEVTKIAPQGTEKDRVVNFEVEVTLTGDATGLRPMMTADAEIVLAEKSEVLLVPEAAVLREGEAAFVERPRGRNGRDRVPVTLGIGNGSDVEVVAGLAEGDEIVGP
jgi:HlyD family secretion protein